MRCCLLFLLFASEVMCAQVNLDSLERVYNTTNLDSVRILSGLRISAELINREPLRSIEIAESLLQLLETSSEINENQKYRYYVSCIHTLALAYNYVGDNQKSIDFYLKELQKAQENNDQRRERNVLMNIGTAFQNQHMKKEAIDYYHKALQIAIKNDEVYGIAVCYGNLGTAYGSIYPDSTMFYYKLSLNTMLCGSLKDDTETKHL